MTKICTPNFRTWAARQFIKSFVGRTSTIDSDTISRYVSPNYVDPLYAEQEILQGSMLAASDTEAGYFYVFAGVSTDWANTIPTPNTSLQGYHYDVYDTMEFGKHVGPEDVSLLVDRHDWVSGEVYDAYSHLDPLLSTKSFFIVVEEGGDYHVFKCLDNAGGSPSTHQPSVFEYNGPGGSILTSTTPIAATNYYYKTSDGYVWAYMYSIPRQTYNKFATTEYIPLTIEQAEVPSTVGSIESILVDTQGAYHNTYLNGFVKQTFVDGVSTKFNLTTSGNDFFHIGDFYKGASIYITSGTGRGQIRNIISSDIVGSERQIVVESAFSVPLDASSQFEIAPQVSIVGDGTGALARSVVNANGQLTQIEMIDSGTGYTTANINIVSYTGYIDANANIITTNTVATATAIISPPAGLGRDLVNELYADKVGISVDFIDTAHPITSYAQFGLIVNPIFKTIDVTVIDVSGFAVGEIAYQQDDASYGVIAAIDSTNNILTLNNVRGVFDVGSEITGINTSTKTSINAIDTDTSVFTIDQLVDNSGEIIFVKNDSIVTRANGQTERVKLVFDF